MIVFSAGGAVYEAFAARFPCRKLPVREWGATGLVDALQEGDVLVHNAANIAAGDQALSVADNFILTKLLVDALEGTRKNIPFIFISSMSMLDKGGAYKDVREMSAYAFAKYIAECYCLRSGLAVSAVRFSTLFYKDPARDGLSKMITDAVTTHQLQLLNGGQDKRDFIPLTVAVEYLYKIAVSPVRDMIYNIASGCSTSFAEAAGMIKEAVPALAVGHKEVQGRGPFVLSEFDTSGLEKLGKLSFSLSEHIEQYVRELS